MVNYQDSDIISMKDFELAWRITDPRWSSLPESVLDRIKPLSDSKSRNLYACSPLSRPLRNPPDVGDLSIDRVQSLEESGPPQDAECYRWFRELPIESTQHVYLCWGIGEGVAAVTDWGTFLEVWDDLWYPFDRMCVFDDTINWAVLFGPEEIVRFAERSIERAVLTPHTD
jgi:hypothetical protein